MSQLVVGGLRGLSEKTTLPLANPNGVPGSGLTILVGSNNAGKSTFIEAFRNLAQRQRRPSFADGQRNKAFGDRVEIRLELSDGRSVGLASTTNGGSETQWLEDTSHNVDIYTIPSRRTFSAYFGDPGGPLPRQEFSSSPLPPLKSATIDSFAGRLFQINRDEASRRGFDLILSRVVDPAPDWTIDRNDEGRFFLKFTWKNSQDVRFSHSSDGLGEGLVSLLFIVDSLYDSTAGGVIVIDEPELSLHPQFQRRLRLLLSEMAKDRHIIYATHSPYFIDWSDLASGAEIVRVFKGPDGTEVRAASREIIDKIARFSTDGFNPHVIGLEANEVFFLEDCIVLTEGQEDVVYLRRILSQLDATLNGSFYGWGVGGAEKMGKLARLLSELGYKLVVGLLDNDKPSEIATLQEQFPSFRFLMVPASDIRDKPARKEVAAKIGITHSDGTLKDEHREPLDQILRTIKDYFASHATADVKL